MRKIQLGIYAAIHFLVDLGCALLLLGQICPNWDPVAAVLFFCLFAFVFQMPIGLLADKIGQSHLFAAAGCLLISAGWMMTPGLAAVTAAGLGNAAFHVGGGLYTLNEEKHKTWPLVLFVSPGAFGVFLGGKYALSVQDWSVGMMLALAAILVILFCKGDENDPFAAPRGSAKLWIVAGCLFVAVILCSLSGLSAVCFLAGNYPALNLAALFLFMIIPLILRTMANLFPGMKGFSLGLLSFGMFLGFLPVFFWWA